MNVAKILSVLIICISSFEIFSQKVRLPENINKHQPTILPIITPDNDFLYLDRKWHPENSGGVEDDDEIWVAKRIDSLRWDEPRRLESDLNIPESNTILYIFPDGNSALVYGNYSQDEKPSERQSLNNFVVTNFGIVRKINEKWDKPNPIKIRNFYTKSKNYSATISSDRRILLLSLERDDSFGELDMYISYFDNSTGVYSEPKNLGSKLNTKGIELVSFLAYDNRTLYFASNGHRGKGDFDLFMVRANDDSLKSWGNPIPLDEFINSEFDESSISLNLWGDTAYFTSGDSESGKSGIYFCRLPEQYQPLPYLIIQGTIKTNIGENIFLLQKPVTFKVDNFDLDYVFYDTIYDGFYRIVIPYNTQYNFFVSAEKLNDISFSSSSKKLDEVRIQNYDIKLSPIFGFVPTQPQKKLLTTIYFDTNVDTLGQFAKQSLYDFRQIFSNLGPKKILIVGHTDEVGSKEFNMNLSLRRAENTALFISETFRISRSQISYEGRGKTEPISKDLSKNRRAEIYLVNDD
ncbi:MAG: OmpA family protein [Ignavibacteria bacterium]|nr:OmpA family protein [Ignavibacteria bacterium]